MRYHKAFGSFGIFLNNFSISTEYGNKSHIWKSTVKSHKVHPNWQLHNETK